MRSSSCAVSGDMMFLAKSSLHGSLHGHCRVSATERDSNHRESLEDIRVLGQTGITDITNTHSPLSFRELNAAQQWWLGSE